MIKGLEALKLLKDFALENNKNGLDRRFIIGSCNILQKELKALEIIKEKRVDIRLLFETFNYYKNGLKAYNGMRTYGYDLAQEEYDLLKEALVL